MFELNQVPTRSSLYILKNNKCSKLNQFCYIVHSTRVMYPTQPSVSASAPNMGEGQMPTAGYAPYPSNQYPSHPPQASAAPGYGHPISR